MRTWFKKKRELFQGNCRTAARVKNLSLKTSKPNVLKYPAHVK